MLYAWIDGVYRTPFVKGEKTVCQDCGGVLTSVIPVENVKHWRHRAGDCDTWSEPEGEWHLSWKEHFDLYSREVSLIDEITGERHRADIFCKLDASQATVLELQHSNISEIERISRESFYGKKHRMFWLIHIHSQKSFNEFSFESALSLSSEVEYADRNFMIGTWAGRSYQFIEKWKRSSVHVFFDWKGYIFYLANNQISKNIGGPFKRGQFAVCALTRSELINSVKGIVTKP
jgi:competence CoiA-like predicted nuclease